MDPITHTILGATAAHVFMSKRLGRGAILFGAAGGALPDIDVVWGNLADPALPWEYHRHFTHALPFIPVVGLIAAAPLLLLFKRFRPQAGAAYIAACIGAATHGVNDTLTSFGTFLYWPFSNQRIAWDVISIIDPLFTVPLVLGVLLAVAVKQLRTWPTRIAFTMAVLYLMLGFVQNQRVLGVQRQLAESRGHDIIRGRAMPTLGNIIIWRSLYEDANGMLHADAIRAGLFSPMRIQAGESIERLTAERLREAMYPFDAQPDFARDRILDVFAGFNDFADGYTAHVPGLPAAAVGDMRYSLTTSGFEPMWGLWIEPHDAIVPVRWTSFARRDPGGRRDAVRALWRDLWQPGEEWRKMNAIGITQKFQGCEDIASDD